MVSLPYRVFHLLFLESLERAAGSSVLYFLPSLTGVSGTSARQVSGAFGAALYGAPLVAIFSGLGRYGLRLAAGLMVVGALAGGLVSRPALLVLAGLVFVLGAGLWKTRILTTFGATGESTGWLHAAIAAGYLAIPLAGMARAAGVLVPVLCVAFALLFVGTVATPVQVTLPTLTSSVGAFSRSLRSLLGLLPLMVLASYPWVNSAAFVKLAEQHGLNAGAFVTLNLAASILAGLLLPGGRRRHVLGARLAWLCLVLGAIGSALLVLRGDNLAAVVVGHLVMGVFDALLHLLIYVLVLGGKRAMGTYFALTAVAHAVQGALGAAEPAWALTSLLVLAAVGALSATYSPQERV